MNKTLSNSDKPKLLRIVTAPISMNIILKGQLGFMNQYFEVVGVTAYDEKHFNEIKARERIRMYAVDLVRAISPLKDLKAFWQIYRIIYREKPDIVHTHTPKAGLLGMMAARLAGVPVRLHTVGGMPLMEVQGPKRRLLNFLERLTYACAHRVYPNSKGLLEFIKQERFCPIAKLKVLGNGGSNGINTDYFNPLYRPDAAEHRAAMRQELGISTDTTVLVFVGRIAREKGIVELVNVLNRLSSRYPLKLVLVGTFEKHYGVLEEETIKSIETNPWILFLGRFDDVRPYYALSDIFVFPSYREGFPNAVLEASAMQLPCVVTDINGCNEIVAADVTGFFIQPKDERTLEKALVKLLDNPELGKKMGQNARQRVDAYFSRQVVWAALLAEYQTLLQNISTNGSAV